MRATSPVLKKKYMDSHFQTDGISLYQGDALRVLTTLPEASVDAVLTDPPYSSGGVTLGGTTGRPGTKISVQWNKETIPAHAGRFQGPA